MIDPVVYKNVLLANTPQGRAGVYADVLSQVCADLALPDGLADAFPFLLAGILERESHSGLALKPQGPTGTGDFAMRKTHNPKYPVLPDASVLEGSEPDPRAAGQTRWYRIITPTTRGWGHGLMQLDYATYQSIIDAGPAWGDPVFNITTGARNLKGCIAFFSASAKAPGDPRPLTGDALYKAAAASYNAGPGSVLVALKGGNDPDAVTADHDYGASVLGSYAKLATAYRAAGGLLSTGPR